jgi:Second Messenger Oligonucleotide or Dinucleotide Synthetase domain
MMGGGGSSYTNWKSDKLAEAVRKDTEESGAEYQVALAGYFSELLGAFNGRDVELVHKRLDQIKESLQDELESTFDQIFGGSVAKHTYVDGLSDIDSLLVINGSKFENENPEKVLKQIVAILRQRLRNGETVEHGWMAVTVSYPDNMSIQLLPAIRSEGGLQIPAAGQNQWSEIEPDAFRNALVGSNAECGGKLVPTIKLAKAVIANLPEKYQLTGYHVESLAVAAFQGYKGEKTTASMLPYFFDRAKNLVLQPIRDPTGQSTHVDEYLGSDDSTPRQEISHILGGITKRMRTASASQSKGQWEALFYNE